MSRVCLTFHAACRVLAALVLLTWGPATFASAQSNPLPVGIPAGVDEGTARYRAGDHVGADEAWRAAFDAATSEGERARLAYNLGNAAYRRGAPLEALGWYLASLARQPRDRAAHANLALARAEAGLPPADGGGLTASLTRAVGAFTAAEAGWLALGGVLVLACALAYEALRGGAHGRLVAALGFGVAAFAFGPLVVRALRPTGERALVIAADGLEGRSEPRGDAKGMAALEPGALVTVRDRYLDWVRVRVPGVEGESWVPAEGLFLLR